MPDVRLAILGASPCEGCTAACCRQNGHEFAVLLQGDERQKFAAWGVDIPVRGGGGTVVERVLPYVDGRCPFLGPDGRCTIYDDRPLSCRQFECLRFFNSEGQDRHGPFLQRNPQVLEMLKRL